MIDKFVLKRIRSLEIQNKELAKSNKDIELELKGSWVTRNGVERTHKKQLRQERIDNNKKRIENNKKEIAKLRHEE